MKAKVTISKRGGYKGEGKFHITIRDEASGLKVTEVSMSLAEFAEAIGGMSECEADVECYPTQYTVERYGKKKIVEHVFMDKSLILGNTIDHRKAAVNSHFSVNWSGDNWELWDDGTRSQQNGKEWRYVICKYVDQEEK